jgi:hypothetical protein
MKKRLLTSLFFAGVLSASAQTFSDDFESYTAGEMLAATSAVWETWSSPNGGADDASVTNNNAHSGTNSLYLSSTGANGGPADIVLPFPTEIAVGQLNLEMWMYVNSGTGAYFNFQETANIGTSWASDIYFLADGTTQFTSGGGLMLECSYPQGAWFKLRMELDMSTNTWTILIDDAVQGTYANTVTQIASMDIYPLQGNQFYIDDVSYAFTDYVLPNLNGAVTNINNMGGGLAGLTVTPSVEVRNLGTTAINAFDVSIDYNGTTLTESVSGVNIASLAFYAVPFTQSLTLAPGNNPVVATISNVNGGADEDANDDVKTIQVNPAVPAPGKIVVAEEGTGTWCPWCVRGAVFMDELSTRYEGYYAGIAVHNADPMTVAAYDAAIGAQISGYPSGLVDRNGTEYDPSQFEIPFLERIQIAPMAYIQNGANWDATTRVLQVSATTTFQQSATGNYKIALVLTEDGVTGTTADYNQANAYAGGANGEMGGYESLPNPVPAAQMVYDHVARVISPSFDGLDNAFNGATTAGNSSTHNFTFDIPESWNTDEMHIIAMVIAPTGEIDNASFTTIGDAITNGFVAGMPVLSVAQLNQPDANFSIYPVPAKESCTLSMHFDRAQDVQIDIYNMMGQKVSGGQYFQLFGSMQLNIPIESWNSGAYIARITTPYGAFTRTLIKE